MHYRRTAVKAVINKKVRDKDNRQHRGRPQRTRRYAPQVQSASQSFLTLPQLQPRNQEGCLLARLQSLLRKKLSHQGHSREDAHRKISRSLRWRDPPRNPAITHIYLRLYRPLRWKILSLHFTGQRRPAADLPPTSLQRRQRPQRRHSLPAQLAAVIGRQL